eukprot:PRCOL_00005798-RA
MPPDDDEGEIGGAQQQQQQQQQGQQGRRGTAGGGQEEAQRKRPANGADALVAGHAKRARSEDTQKENQDEEGQSGPEDEPEQPPQVIDTEEEEEDASAFRRALQPVRAIAAHVEGGMMEVTAPSGERAYVGQDAALAAPPPPAAPEGASRGRALLGVPLSELLLQVDEAQAEKLSRRKGEVDRRLEAAEAGAGANGGTAAQRSSAASDAPARLWVDKYAPQSFTELLSDERGNRELLRWLSSWSRCTGARAGGEQDGGAPAPPPPAAGAQGDDNRPEVKVVLLCGAPGLGKTTLANVAASHCGYRVVEINASDERQASALKKRVTDAVQMQSVMAKKGERQRPNCVVIDEIDGLVGGPEGRGAVDALLKIINAGAAKKGAKDAPPPEDGEGGDGQDGGGQKRRKKEQKLMRPIVCICNDLYAPSIRRLREQALVLRFDAPPASALVPRLNYICRQEGFLADKRALHALAEKAEGDVRSCLNTLQFAKARKECLKLYDVQSLPIGRKDRTKSLFELWSRLLQSPEFRRRRRVSGEGPGQRFSTSGHKQRARRAEFDAIYSAVEDADAELVLAGLMENLEAYPLRDADLKRSAQAAEWASYGDELAGTARKRGFYSALRYMPAATLGVHKAIAGSDRARPRWPTAQAAMRRGAAETGANLAEWRQGISPALQSAVGAGCTTALQTEYASSLLRISNPKLAPNAFGRHVRNSEHGDAVGDLVGVMLAYGLSYRPVARAGGGELLDSGPMEMRPPLRELCTFEGKPPGGVRSLSAPVCRALQAEANREAITRSALAASADAVDGDPAEASPQGDARPTEEAKRASEAAAMAVVDKYKKIKAKHRTAARERTGKSNAEDRPVLFKYNEGFTNAVRRPISVADLLLCM